MLDLDFNITSDGPSLDATPAEAAEDARQLDGWLSRLAGPQRPPRLSATESDLLRPGAASLLDRFKEPRSSDLRSLTDSVELGAAAASVDLLTDALLRYWEPLLQLCKDGKTDSPLWELKSALHFAEALEETLAPMETGSLRDQALARSQRARAELQQWIPPKSASAAAASQVRYEKPPTPPPRAAAPSKSTTTSTASDATIGRRHLLLAALAAVLLAAALSVGIGVFGEPGSGPDPEVAAYLPALPSLRSLKPMDTIVVVRVGPEFAPLSRSTAEGQLMALRRQLEAEGYERFLVYNHQGRRLLQVDDEGVVTWAGSQPR